MAALKNKWHQEKEFYKTKEIGDGVQTFVIEALESDIFNLKRGLGSSLNSQRSNEFTLEHSKEGRRADVVIHINTNIKIPIEIEKFENIKAGEKQIIAYQKDWDKKYGILTDGFTWRFYNNTKYQIFTINDLFDKTKEFQSFWNDYIKEDNYYLEFFNPKQDGLFKQENKPIKVQENQDLFFSETTSLIEKFITKTELCEKIKDKKLQTELAYSYLIQFILVKVLVDSGFEIFINDYNEKLQNILTNLKKGFYSRILATIRNLSSAIEKDLYKPFKEDQKFINERLDELLTKEDEEIGDISIWLDIVCYIHRFNFSGITNDIFGSIYENYLKELYSEENLGQFFTPPEVVDFMLEEIGWTEDEIRKRAIENKDNLSIIDPSCGSGTFLYSATNILMNAITHDTEEQSKFVEHIVNQNIFGLDVEEFSLYLAEMSILMRLLPCVINQKYNNPIDKKLKIFKTKDSIAEFINLRTEEKNLQLFDKYTQLSYDSLMRDEKDLKDLKASIKPPKTRFDFVIGNPPYIGYNECSKMKLPFIAMCRDKATGASMNNIYGVNMHSVPENPKKYAPKPNLYSFFMALGNGLLKDNGKMCYIIPQTLLTNTDYDVMRYHLAKNMQLEKIITFSCKMFVDRGSKKKRDIATSSLIFVVKKALPDTKQKVEILHYEKSDAGVIEALKDIRKGKNTIKKQILQNELLENVDNWNYIKQGKEFLKFYEYYKKNSEDLSCYYEHKKARERFMDEFYFDGSVNVLKKDIIIDNIKDSLFVPKMKKNFFNVGNLGFYQVKNKIKQAHGSQGFDLVLNGNFKIIWKYIGFDGFYYSNIKNTLPIYQQYCISSNNKDEINYLISLLNSAVHEFLLAPLFKVEQEDKLTFVVGLTRLKKFIRIPIITPKNQHIKEKIIEQTEKMLALENFKLKDLVSFKSKLAVLPQKFEKIEVQNGFLLCDDVKFEIIKNKAVVEKLIAEKNKELSGNSISLQSLKDLEAIDFELRDAIKNYIDYLVFALYCNVELDQIEFEDLDEIIQKCKENEFYSIIFKH
jgi:type I restriction-modification system DNA methylase subunit